MKGRIMKLLIGSTVALSVMGIVLAEDGSRTIQVNMNKIKLMVNQVRINADNLLYNGTTYVPIRAVAESLGKEVTWDDKSNTAIINEATSQSKEIIIITAERITSYRNNVSLSGGNVTDQDIINRIIEEDILVKEADKRGITVTKEEISKQVIENKKMFEQTASEQDKQLLDKFTSDQKITYDEYWSVMLPQIYEKRMKIGKLKKLLKDELKQEALIDHVNWPPKEITDNLEILLQKEFQAFREQYQVIIEFE